MSTIASPRPSISTSSRRTSTSTDTTAAQATAAERGSLRRNRAALRDYYGLKAAGPADARDTPPPTPSFETERESELDRPDFNSATYVSNLLAKEGVEGVLRVEAGLVSEIRSLDGEKKALVYDNYSKLIAATNTIRNMREKMDPLTPTTSTLTPAIGHIAETASTLSQDLKKPSVASGADMEVQKKRQEQQATVRWVLATPARLQRLVEDGQLAEAQKEWEEVSGLLDTWSGVRGVNDLRHACLKALEQSNTV